MTKEDIREKITTNPNWCCRAILAIYAKQTEDEKLAESTNHHNTIGFNGCDAKILSSFAKQIQSGRKLSEKQMAVAYKSIGKYAGQLAKIAEETR